MKLSGHTRPYAVLGHPIGHTLSPAMHNASFRALGLDAIYLAFDVAPERLLEVLPAMREMGFGGVNLTIPHKEVAFRGLDDLDDSAKRFGAVNTVAFPPEGGLRGHTTDSYGFTADLRESLGASPAGKTIFLLGTGGAGRTVAITCAAQGAGRLVLTDMAEERTRRVADEIRDIAPGLEVAAVPARPQAWRDAAAAAELIIQATPVGMRTEDASLLPPEAFHAGQLVYDLVYMYPETAFMKAARSGGARAANGLGMLLHQGARSFTIWTGRQPDLAAMRTALEAGVYGRKG